MSDPDITLLDTGRHLLDCSAPNCFRYLTFETREEAEADKLNHPCPWWGGQTKVAWSVTKTLVEKLWDMMDADMDQIASGGPMAEYHKNHARGLADATALFMRPFFETADDIVREVVKRKKARDAGEEYETPGLGARRYEVALMDPAERYASGPSGAPTGRTAGSGTTAARRAARAASGPRRASKPAVTLSEQEQNAIREAHKQMPTVFTPAVLAKQYSVSEAVVKEIVGT